MTLRNKLVLILLLMGWATIGLSGTFTVNFPADNANSHDANPGDGLCRDLINLCTFRAALEEANANAGVDTILFTDAMAGQTIEIAPSEGPLPVITAQVLILAELIDGYNLSATLLRDAPPQITIDGSLFSAGSADGLSFSGSAATLSVVSALSIVGFPGDGIQVAFGADTLTIHRNYIGIRPDGTTDGNGGHGVYIASTDSHIIGKARTPQNDAFSGLGNVVSANGLSGIRLESSTLNRVNGNLIGIRQSGSGDRGNGQYGIHLSGSSNTLGDFVISESAGNYLAGNDLGSILVIGDQNVLVSNSLGIGETGSFIHSELDGIVIDGDNNTIGQSGSGGNRIVEHDGSAIRLGKTGSSADSNLVRNNRIGNSGAISPLLYSANGAGINVVNGDGNHIHQNHVINSIGNADLGLIGIGINVLGSFNTINGNRVGFFPILFGISAEPNINSGIFTEGTGNIIGTFDFPNQVGGNQGRGIGAWGNNNHVSYNFVGVTDDFELIGNDNEGIQVQNGSGNVVSHNIVGGNARGIGTFAIENGFISANWIGTTSSGHDIGNSSDGIRVNNSSDFYISANTIALNGGDGIAVVSDSTSGVEWYGNSMYGNGDLGVDLDADGATANDPGDPDEGPNRLQNHPIIESVILDRSVNPATLTVTYRIDSEMGAAQYPISVDFYWSHLNETPQGRIYLGTNGQYSTPNESKMFILQFPSNAGFGWLTMTATEQQGNSSEFSPTFLFGEIPFLIDGFESP